MQSTRGLERTKQVEAFYNFSLGSSEGLCAGSSGAFDNATCDASGTVHARKRAAPAPPFAVADTGDECVQLCLGCARCGFASFSLALRRCTWHRRADDACKRDRRADSWTFQTKRVVRGGESRPAGAWGSGAQ